MLSLKLSKITCAMKLLICDCEFYPIIQIVMVIFSTPDDTSRRSSSSRDVPFRSTITYHLELSREGETTIRAWGCPASIKSLSEKSIV